MTKDELLKGLRADLDHYKAALGRRRAVLCDELRDSIRRFQGDTGVTVSSVRVETADVRPFDDEGPDPVVVAVDIDISLEGP